MGKLKTKIIEILQQENKALTVSEIANLLKLTSGKDFKVLVKTISQMEKEASVLFTKVGKVKLPAPEVLLEGTLRLNDRGFGFVTLAEETEDVYISKENIHQALDGDTVAIDILQPADPFSNKGAEGKIVAILKRKLETIPGEFTAFSKEIQAESGFLGKVQSTNKKYQQYEIYVTDTGLKPVTGNIVVVSIATYPTEKEAFFTGVVATILGHKNDPGVDILALVTGLGIPTKFPEEVLKEAQEIPEVISKEELATRKDRTQETIVTIDGEDAKDLDDAVTVRKLANGNYFLGVHIADVSHYVTKGSALNEEAYNRGTSVYLVDRVIPMLPQRLSNDLCSLNPKVIRLTLSCEMEINPKGQVVSHEIFKSYVKTTARMTYTAVNEILEEHNPETLEKYQALVPMFQEMKELHEILEKMRLARGAINFEDRETRVLVDPTGKPIDIVLRSRGVGEKMIESFMLAANETVANHFQTLHLPFIYRIHEAPKEEKLERFFEFISVFGLEVKGYKKELSAPEIQKLLEKVADKPEGPVISTMLLRSMQQAKYDIDPVGHYGLGADDYTHFTSPIRRYPDLMVHRLIHFYQETKTELPEDYSDTLEEIARHASQMERKAVDAERQVDAMKKAEFMVEHVGETFEGVISSVTKFGFFVELPNTIEGLVHLQNLHQDYFHFIEGQMALVGERTNQVFKLGEKVTVEVTKSDPDTREIDFKLIASENNKLKGNPHKKPSPSKRNQDQNRESKRRKKRKGSSDRYKESQSHTTPRENPSHKNKKKKKRPFYQGVARKKKRR